MGRVGQQESQALGEGSVPFLPGEGGGEAHTSSLNAGSTWLPELSCHPGATVSPGWPELSGALHSTQEWMLQLEELEAPGAGQWPGWGS